MDPVPLPVDGAGERAWMGAGTRYLCNTGGCRAWRAFVRAASSAPTTAGRTRRENNCPSDWQTPTVPATWRRRCAPLNMWQGEWVVSSDCPWTLRRSCRLLNIGSTPNGNTCVPCTQGLMTASPLRRASRKSWAPSRFNSVSRIRSFRRRISKCSACHHQRSSPSHVGALTQTAGQAAYKRRRSSAQSGGEGSSGRGVSRQWKNWSRAAQHCCRSSRFGTRCGAAASVWRFR